MKLYEIKELYQRFANMVEEGLIDEDAIADTFESIEGEFEEKADNISCLIKTWQAEAEAIKCEEMNLKARRERKEKQAENLKQYLSATMQQLGKEKLETSRNVLSFRKSSSLRIENEITFKIKYPELVKVETVESISKKDITTLIKNGKAFEGAEIITNQNLQIK